MRLSERHKYIIEAMESDGYIWLSHLPHNAEMRFRNKTRKGFTGYVKVEGLTFLTERVAEQIKRGCKEPDKPRMTYRQQVDALEDDLVQLEKELYQCRKENILSGRYKYETTSNHIADTEKLSLQGESSSINKL